MGSRTLNQRQAASYFREPWKFPDSEIQNIVRSSKRQFFQQVLTCVGSQDRKSGLNIFAQCLLMLYKLCHQISFATLAVLFALNSAQTAYNVFYRQTVHQFKFNCNIPAVIYNNQVNPAEVNKLLRDSHMRTQLYYKMLLRDFDDPAGLDRTPVALNIDGTYFDIAGSSDLELQKYMYYKPRSGHTVKFLNLTDLAPKFVGILPVASSQTPSSGDGLLLAKHIELEDTSSTGQYMRSILRGNDQFFVILICDAGFVIEVPNAPVQSRGPNAVTLASVCEEEHCVLLHTSSKYERYHLEKTETGKIRKVPWVPDNPTLDENVVKFTRFVKV